MENLDHTQPSRPAGQGAQSEDLSQYQPIRLPPRPGVRLPQKPPKERKPGGCLAVLLVALVLLTLAGVYIFFPVRTNLVLMGIDDRKAGESLGRSDTLILLTLKPVDRYVGMLSIPRDLWVEIPGVGQNRINTAHFFAEAENPGSGPEAVKAVIETNFKVHSQYFVRVRFDNFKDVVALLGGIRVNLAEPMGGYPAGEHLLDADQSLAFVRDRTSGGDDFARMRQTQVFVRALIETALSPVNLPRLPQLAGLVLGSIETDIPVYIWPRLAAAVLLAMPDGIDGRVITRDMVNPFTTNQGAQVLGPNWDLIRPVVLEMFGE